MIATPALPRLRRVPTSSSWQGQLLVRGGAAAATKVASRKLPFFFCQEPLDRGALHDRRRSIERDCLKITSSAGGSARWAQGQRLMRRTCTFAALSTGIEKIHDAKCGELYVMWRAA